MSLRFIIGNSAKKNREAMLSLLTAPRAGEPAETFFFVPEQAALEAERSLCEGNAGGCVMDVDVVSFRRLTHRLQDELGQRIPAVLDDIGKTLILVHRMIEDAALLPTFGSKVMRPGFANEIMSLISEFVRYEVDADMLADVASKTEERMLSDKLGELAQILRSFRESCGDTHITEDDIYNAMCPLVKESKRLQGSVLFFDGYTGFTPTQYNLVRELMKVCRDVVMTVTIDPEEAERDATKGTQCFRMSRETMDTMRQIAQETGHRTEPPIVTAEDPGEREASLRYLSQSLFRRGVRIAQDRNPASIRLMSSPDMREEVRSVVSDIAFKVRKKGERYGDMCVVCGDVDAYSEELRRQFAEAHIPFFIDRTSEVRDNCLIDYVRSLFEMIGSNMEPDCVMRWLRNPLQSIDTERLDYLENFLIARGVRGMYRWERGLSGDYGGKRVTAAEDCIVIAKQVYATIAPLARVLSDPKTGVVAKTEALYTFLESQDIYHKLLAISEELETEPVPWHLRRSREYASVYRALMELLDHMHELLPQENISLRNYAELMETGFSELRLGVIPPQADSVLIGDRKRSRISSVRNLYFLGMNDGVVPGASNSGELLNTRERELLRDRFRIVLSDSQKESIDVEEFYVLLTIQKPTDELVLSWRRTDDEGKAMSESYVIRRIQRLFPDIPVRTEAAEGGSFFDRIAVDGGRSELLEHFADAKGNERAKTTGGDPLDTIARRVLYDWYYRLGAGDERLLPADKMADAAKGFRAEAELSEETAAQLFSEDTEFSVTRLQTFAECPFKHFARYGLAADERETYEPSSLVIGNAYHQILDHAGKQWMESKRNGEPNDPERLCDWIREGADAIRNDPDFECLLDSERNRYLLQSIEDNLLLLAPRLTNQMTQGRYAIAATESPFREEFDGCVFTGKIDRVDTCTVDGEEYVKVIDYKTSGREYVRDLADAGIDIQIPLYLRIEQKRAEKEGRVVKPAAGLYQKLSVDSKTVTVDESKEDFDAEADAKKKLNEYFRPEGIVLVDSISDGKLDATTDPYLSLLDVRYSGDAKHKSDIVPVLTASAQKGGISQSAMTPESMQQHIEAIERLAVDEARRIRGGEIEVLPYHYGGGSRERTGCDYCPYNGICKTEPFKTTKYRELGGEDDSADADSGD